MIMLSRGAVIVTVQDAMDFLSGVPYQQTNSLLQYKMALDVLSKELQSKRAVPQEVDEPLSMKSIWV